MSEMERRSAERRPAERDTMRDNPEVMGRNEPVPIDQARAPEHPARSMATEPVTTRPEAGPTATEPMGGHDGAWPEMHEIRLQFDQLQSEFIDNPRDAVKKAERLMEEAVDRITRSMRDRMQTVHRDVGDNNSDTERLRLAMRSYREMIYSLGGSRAA